MHTTALNCELPLESIVKPFFHITIRYKHIKVTSFKYIFIYVEYSAVYCTTYTHTLMFQYFNI